MKKQLFILLLLVSGNVLAQRAAVKTNLLHDAATAPSLAAEWAFASRWTLDVAGSAVRGILRTTGSGNSG